MKIAFLNIYQGVVDRGAENFVKETAGRLADRHEVKVYSWPGEMSEKTARSQTPLNFLGRVLYKFYLDNHSRRVLIFTLKVLPEILRRKPDWIIPVDGGWETLALKTLQKRQNFKILISGQAGIGRDDLRNLQMKPNIFVALTRRAERWAREVAGGLIKIVRIPNGVNIERFNPVAEPVELNLISPIVICVAGLNPYKRVDLTIRAVAKLKSVGFLLLGDGPEREKIERLGQELLGEKRFLRTTVPYEEIPRYYAAASVFTLCSASSEAFGSSYLEAMACGLPVVATDDETRKEIIGEAGVFVEPNDIEKYAEALGKAIVTNWKDKPRRQAEKFSWDKIAEEYGKVMEAT